MTRRGLGTSLAGAAASAALAPALAAAAAAGPLPDPDQRDAALRGLALAAHRGDPVTAAAAETALVRLAQTDPEAALLGRIYRLLDVRPSQWWADDMPEAAAADLGLLHGAIRACQPVAFRYRDLSQGETSRRVLPLALVHPPQGVKLLAWCELRADFRQFFVRAMQGLTAEPGSFAAPRMTLLQGLLEKEEAKA